MEIKLNVKDRSVATFLEERLLGCKQNDRNPMGMPMNGMHNCSAYHLMTDVMFFKKDCGILVGETVRIELSDRGEQSQRELKNIYVYEAEQYDDVAIKMVLKNFTIDPGNKE